MNFTEELVALITKCRFIPRKLALLSSPSSLNFPTPAQRNHSPTMKHSSGVCLRRAAVAAVAAPLCDPILSHSSRCAALKFWGQIGVGWNSRTSLNRHLVNAGPGIHWKESIQRPGRGRSLAPHRSSSRTVRKVLRGNERQRVLVESESCRSLSLTGPLSSLGERERRKETKGRMNNFYLQLAA